MSTVEEAFLIATYVISRLPTCVLQGISPVEHMLSFSPLPLLSSLSCYVFGCIAFVHSHSPHRGKLDPRVVKCVFKLKGGVQVLSSSELSSFLYQWMSPFIK